MTSNQLHILRHSLGLDDIGRGNQYRNHYVCGPGHDSWSDCQELCSRGLVVRHEPREIFGGGCCFTVTEAGKTAVEAAKTPEKKTTLASRRYKAWLHADNGMSFIEWLKTDWAKGVK